MRAVNVKTRRYVMDVKIMIYQSNKTLKRNIAIMLKIQTYTLKN